ncbi:MAG: MFS transporter [Gemmatimonadetes bacterium]|nr:MFS transporter [Gemmatimonadota bacterium]
MAAAVPFSFATWRALLNNFAVDEAGFTGIEIGILQSVREIPGFLAFGVIFVIRYMREQTVALLSLVILGFGVCITGFSTDATWLYLTTVIMSIGFHYFEAVKTSLFMQWAPKEQAPVIMGKIVSAGSIFSIVSFGIVWLAFEWLHVSFNPVYLLGGGLTIAMVVLGRALYPYFPQHVEQKNEIVLKRSYWLYYALTFLSGARRQIFVVFAGFLLVEKFGLSVGAMSLLFLATTTIMAVLAPIAGRWIRDYGERNALIVEYVGLVIVFLGYAVAGSVAVVVALYLLDNLLFSLSTSIKTYFQKIGEPEDFAATASVGFTINHIAAVGIPVVFGLLWARSPSMVFQIGAGLAAISLVISCLVPRHPTRETRVTLPFPTREASGRVRP